jgi:hypothetical protein
VVQQIRLTRQQSRTAGNVLWNMRSLMRNQDKLADTLQRELYAQPALIPVFAWITEGVPGKPRLELHARSGNKSTTKLTWAVPGAHPAWLWLCQSQRDGRWTSTVLPRGQNFLDLPKSNAWNFPDLIAVTAVDRSGAAGPTALFDPRQALAKAGIPASKPSSLSPAAPAPTAASKPAASLSSSSVAPSKTATSGSK